MGCSKTMRRNNAEISGNNCFIIKKMFVGFCRRLGFNQRRVKRFNDYKPNLMSSCNN